MSFRVGADENTMGTVCMKQKHARLCLSLEIFCVRRLYMFSHCLSDFRYGVRVYVRQNCWLTSMVLNFLEFTIPFGRLLELQSKSMCCLFNTHAFDSHAFDIRIVIEIFVHTFDRIFDFGENSTVENIRWTNSIHVLLHLCLFQSFHCIIAMHNDISYALQLLVCLLLSFYSDDCILIPISFFDHLRSSNNYFQSALCSDNGTSSSSNIISMHISSIEN